MKVPASSGFSVSVGLMEGMHERTKHGPDAVKTLLWVTGAIVQSPRSLPKHVSHLLKWRHGALFFSGNAQRALACATLTLRS